MTRYSPAASAAIQAVYDDPAYKQLADRLEEMLDLLAEDPGDVRLRRHLMQKPKYWLVKVYGSGRDFSFFWEEIDGVTWVHWAGDY